MNLVRQSQTHSSERRSDSAIHLSSQAASGYREVPQFSTFYHVRNLGNLSATTRTRGYWVRIELPGDFEGPSQQQRRH